MTAGIFETPPCETLPPDVSEKYFYADYYRQLYAFRTAQAICGGCVIQEQCLAKAIATPGDHFGIRGGESSWSIRRLHVEYNQTDVSAGELARGAIARHRQRPGVERLRKADFQPNVPVRALDQLTRKDKPT